MFVRRPWLLASSRTACLLLCLVGSLFARADANSASAGQNVQPEIVHSQDWINSDNLVSTVLLFKAFPNNHIHFIIDPRAANFKFAPLHLESLFSDGKEWKAQQDWAPKTLKNQASSLEKALKDAGIDRARASQLARYGKAATPGKDELKRLPEEFQGWFEYDHDRFEFGDSITAASITMAQVVLALDEYKIPRSRYTLYWQDETARRTMGARSPHVDRLDMAFYMNEDEREKLFKAEEKVKTNKVWKGGQDYFKNSLRQQEYTKIFEDHLHRLEKKLGGKPNYSKFEVLADNIGDKPCVWHLAASMEDFIRFRKWIIVHPKQNVKLAVGQYGRLNSGAHISGDQFNVALGREQFLAAFNNDNRPPGSPNLRYKNIFETWFVPTEATKSTPGLKNEFAFTASRWKEIMPVLEQAPLTKQHMLRYADENTKTHEKLPEAMYDVVSAIFFAQRVHKEYPETVQMGITGMDPPPYRDVEVAVTNPDSGKDIVKFKDSRKSTLHCFFWPKDKGKPYQEVERYQKKSSNVEDFWRIMKQVLDPGKKPQVIEKPKVIKPPKSPMPGSYPERRSVRRRMQ